MTKKNFVFIDESGTNLSDRYFAFGCLIVPVEKIGEYQELLKVKQSQIMTKVKEKELELENNLSDIDLLNFYKGRKAPYELKFKYINENTLEPYKWLITQYFKFSDIRFCCLVIDRQTDHPPLGWDYFDLYLERLNMLLKNNVSDNEFVVLPDDITVPRGKSYENTLMGKLKKNDKNCFGVHRIESHSDIFLQMVDVLTGAVLHGFKDSSQNFKTAIVDKICRKIGKPSLTEGFTVKLPNYFSIWIYKPKTS